MSLCPARIKKIQTKMKALECSHFSYCKSMGNFPDVQGQLWSDQDEFRTHSRLEGCPCPNTNNFTQEKKAKEKKSKMF